MGWHGGGTGPGAGAFTGLFWVLLLGGLGWLVVRLLPARTRVQVAGEPRGQSPQDILDRRLGLGEIDQDTYTAQRAALVPARAQGR